MKDVSGPCQKCGLRPAKTFWVGTGCQLCATRRGFEGIPMWCEECAVEAQIAYCTETAAKIPGLQAKLKALKAATNADQT